MAQHTTRQKNRKRYNVPIVHFQITKSMYVDKTTVTRKNGEEYTQYLLRTSKRQGKKTIKTTLLNITHYGVDTCEAIRFSHGCEGEGTVQTNLSRSKSPPNKP